MKNPFLNAAVSDIVGIDGWKLVEQMESLNDLATMDMGQMNIFAELVYNFTECMDIDFIAFDTEDDMLTEAELLRHDKRLLAGRSLL